MELLIMLIFFIIFIVIVLNSTTNSKNDEIMKKYNEVKKRNKESIINEKNYHRNISNNSLFNNVNLTSNLHTTRDNHYESSFDINPANGLPMIGDSMIDVDGNTYGSSGD